MAKTFITLLIAALLLVTFAYAEEFGETVKIMTGSNSLFYNLDESASESLAIDIEASNNFDFTLSNTTSFTDNTLYAFVVETSSSNAGAVTVTVSYNYDELTQVSSIPNSIKFVSKSAGVLPNQIQDTDAMVLNVTLTVPLNSAALELAIVHEPMPEQPTGFGSKISYNGGSGNKDSDFVLAGKDTMKISVNSDDSFDMEATYYGSENPTSVAPGEYNTYYFFELSVGNNKARAIKGSVGGAFRYGFDDSKDSVADNLVFLIFDGSKWVEFKETNSLDTNTRILTQNFQQAEGGFPGYGSKKHYAIGASISGGVSGSTVDVSGQTSDVVASSGAHQASSGNAQQSAGKSAEVVESSPVSATVSSASTKGFTLITALVVIIAVLGL